MTDTLREYEASARMLVSLHPLQITECTLCRSRHSTNSHQKRIPGLMFALPGAEVRLGASCPEDCRGRSDYSVWDWLKRMQSSLPRARHCSSLEPQSLSHGVLCWADPYSVRCGWWRLCTKVATKISAFVNSSISSQRRDTEGK